MQQQPPATAPKRFIEYREKLWEVGPTVGGNTRIMWSLHHIRWSKRKQRHIPIGVSRSIEWVPTSDTMFQ